MKPGFTNAELEQWADQRRQDYCEGRLSAFQINKLESLDGWSWNVKSSDKDAL